MKLKNFNNIHIQMYIKNIIDLIIFSYCTTDQFNCNDGSCINLGFKMIELKNLVHTNAMERMHF